MRYKAKQLSINNVREGNYSYLSGTYYMDIMEENERLSDCVEKLLKNTLFRHKIAIATKRELLKIPFFIDKKLIKSFCLVPEVAYG